MPYFVYLALKQLFPTGRKVSVFAVLSVLGVTLGVMVLLVVQSVMNGFGSQLREKLNQTTGDIRIVNGGVIYQPWLLVDQLQAKPEVAHAVAYAEGIVLLQHDNRPSFPLIHGIDVTAPQQVLPLDEFLQGGATLADLDDERVFLGSSLAQSVQARPGDYIDVYTPLLLEKLKRDEVLLPRELEVAGIFESGRNEVDSNTIIVTLRTMQELYGLDQAAHGVALKLKPGTDVESFALQLNQELTPPLRAFTWLDTHQQFLFILVFEKAAMFILNLVIVLVAAFCVAVALYTAVLRKTREIGLLNALGGRPRAIASIYCLEGFIVGNLGTVLGFACGLTLLHFREPLVRTVLRITESEALFVRFYNFLSFPVQYSTSDFLFIYGFTIVLTTLAGLVPAWIAARQNPAEALRYE